MLQVMSMLQTSIRIITARLTRSIIHPYRCLSSYRQPHCSLVDDGKFRKYISRLIEEYDSLTSQSMLNTLSLTSRDRLLHITRTAELAKDLQSTDNDLLELTAAIKNEGEESMAELLKAETLELAAKKEHIFDDIVADITPVDTDTISDIILEVHAGVGGLEAAMFAHDLYLMYQQFSVYQGWSFVPCSIKEMEGGTSSRRAINSIQVELSGPSVYKLLKFESGIHRVQRVPSTEKTGRIHTSTAVVVILPKPTNINIDVQEKDIKVATFRSQGGGGQSVNTTNSAVRLTHLPTGTVVECQQTRSQIENRNLAMKHLKSRIYEQQLCDQQAKTTNMRKLQIGGANRNEKIRTYNYAQDRVTDHRVKLTLLGISKLLEGGEATNNFLHSLMDLDQQERFKLWLSEQPDDS